MNNKKIKITQDEFNKRIKENNPNIIVLESFEKINGMIKYKCSICGYEDISMAGSLAKGTTKCGMCSGRKAIKGVNTINVTHPNLLNYFVNKEDAEKYTYGSAKKVLIRCPICGDEKIFPINKLSSNRFSCNKCSDGRSYFEKLMYCLLKQLNINFINEASFKWSKPYIYDFCFDNIIIEMDGKLHRIDNNMNGETVEDVIQRDKIKDILAFQNGYRIIRIICKERDFNKIKQEIYNSKLKYILNLDEIDWIKLEKEIENTNLIKDLSKLWNEGKYTNKEISNIMKISPPAVTRYLKSSARLGWTDYHPKEKIRNFKLESKQKIKIICLETGIIYNSIKEAEDILGFKKDSIGRVCRGERLSIHNLHFDFLETTKEIQKNKKSMELNTLKPHYAKQVMCLETNKVFQSATECDRYYNLYKGATSANIKLNKSNKLNYTFTYI